LTTFKEQLIDVVARRNILIARTRDQLKKGKKQEARKLLDQLDELPNRSALSRQLDGVENNSENRSENPRVQAKIERMLADSRKLLGSFLSTREIIELEVEVNNSETTSVEKTPAEPTERQL
jgi:small-conductance mechanosensitive channel